MERTMKPTFRRSEGLFLPPLVSEGVLEHIVGKKGTFVRESGNGHVYTNLIGVAIDDVRNTFGAQMLRGIEDFLWEKRFHPIN